MNHLKTLLERNQLMEGTRVYVELAYPAQKQSGFGTVVYHDDVCFIKMDMYDRRAREKVESLRPLTDLEIEAE